MIAVLACEAPLTPDEEEARDWLLKELSRVEYSEAPSPIVRFVEAIIRWFTEALSWKGQGAPPISLILMIIAIIAIAGVIIALILNRFASRGRPRARSLRRRQAFRRPRRHSTKPLPHRIGALRTCGRIASWSWAWTNTKWSHPRPA